MAAQLYPLYDRLLGGRLEARLREFADDDLSYAAMARRLFVENQVDVSYETVRRWCDDLGIENPRRRPPTDGDAAA